MFQVAKRRRYRHQFGFELPPIVPIPTDTELVAVDGQTGRSTHGFVSSFDRLLMASEVDVERRLERDGKKSFKAEQAAWTGLACRTLRCRSAH